MRPLVLICAVALLVAGGAAANTYKWDLPEGFAPPPVPADNPMTAEKVELGRYLFYDKRMSGNGRQACASCHMQKFAFTDGRPHAVGSTGQAHPRGSMSLVNIAWSTSLTWANPALTHLEDQARVPMFGTRPVELGLDPQGQAFLAAVKQDRRYQKLFRQAYPKDADPYTVAHVVGAIASFERTIISAKSPWDDDWRQLRRLSSFNLDFSVTSEAARRGEVLFFSKKLACFRCHSGIDFNTSIADNGHVQGGAVFHNNGMPAGAPGAFEYTKRPSDAGKFKAPTMRNVALTAPYMHDGSLPTLEAVIDHYAKGGSHTPNQSKLVKGFTLSRQERADLLAFLHSLTDTDLTHNPKFSDPWKAAGGT